MRRPTLLPAAFAAGRDFVLPEDAAELVPYVFGHRLMLSSRAKLNDYTPEAILAQVLEETPGQDDQPQDDQDQE